MSQKAVVLFSGGLDSTTCIAIAKEQGYEVHALTIDYKQRHQSELLAASRVLKFFDITHHKTLQLPLNEIGGSALTDTNISVQDFNGGSEIPNTYVPARNTIFLSFALGFAEVIDASAIFVGTNCLDYSHYPDCRPEYLQAMQNVFDLATKKTVEGSAIKIFSPLLYLTKAQIIEKGINLGVDYSLTVSCYRANEEGLACGTCDSCTFRKKGFFEANITDPTRYI